MAKKSVETIEGSAAELAVNSIRKKYGAGIALTAAHVIENPKKVLSISPCIDLNLGGGIPEGCLVLLSGQPKSGKTTTALQIAKSGQDDNRDIFYLSVEGRFRKKNATGVLGLNADKINLIQSEKGKILTGEDFLNIGRDIIKDVPKSIVIVDSTSNISPGAELDKEITGVGRALGPRMFGEFCRTIAGTIPINDTIVVALQHVITNTSGYGSPFMEDGGLKLKYQSEILMRANSFSKWADASGKQVGQIINWKVVWSGEGVPVDKFESYLRYGIGIDKVKELIVLGQELGIIEKAGSWLEYNGMKSQGEEKLWVMLNDNPKLVEELSQAVYSMSV